MRLDPGQNQNKTKTPIIVLAMFGNSLLASGDDFLRLELGV